MGMSKTHEKVCGGRSSWDVIKSHDDYKQSGEPREQVVFNVMYNDNDEKRDPAEKQCGRPVILLLDFSYSMTEKNRFDRQKQVGTKFIEDILPFSTDLGIVAFARSPVRAVASLLKLKTDDDKKNMVSILLGNEETTKLENDYTNIAAALLDAVEMLKDGNFPADQSRIVLLTDGEENPYPFNDPKIRDILPVLLASGVKVHSIAVGDQAAEDLGDLCTQTGGQLGKYVETMDSASLTQVVNNLWGDFNMLCVEEKPIEIENKAFVLDNEHPEVEGTVSIDSTIDKADITFTPQDDGEIAVTLTSPDNIVFNKESPERSTGEPNIVRFKFDNMKPGEWKHKIKSATVFINNQEQVIMNVKAKAKGAVETYEVRSWLSSIVTKVPAVTRIYAEVTHGYLPLIKAKVTATIEIPGDGKVTVELADNGIWPDVKAFDGIYTAEFQKPDGHGGALTNERYSVDITVTPVDGQTSLVQKLEEKKEESDKELSEDAFDVEFKEEDMVTEPVESFHRVSSPGAFDIQSETSSEDLYPPERVVDLRAVSETDDGFITVEWTAPGDDLKQGTASEYEFRIWHNDTELRADITCGILLQPESAVLGSLQSPSPAGTKEVMKFKQSDWPFPYLFIAMVSRDDSSQQSEVSNIAVVFIETENEFKWGPYIYIYAIVYFLTRLLEFHLETQYRG